MYMADGQITSGSGRQSGEVRGMGDGRNACFELDAHGERAGRLAALRASVEAGTYRIPSTVLAECLMRRMLQSR